MRATPPNAFALRNSGLHAFLYADVGAELNGSALTTLSMIARLGRDPWAEAARWAELTRAGAIESLAQSIAQMPLAPAALAKARATAERLVQLLPATKQGRWRSDAAKAGAPSVPAWVLITLLYCAMSFGMAVSAFLTPKPSQAVATPTDRSVAVPEAGAAPPVALFAQ